MNNNKNYNKLKKGDKVAAVTLSWGGPGHIPDKYQYGKDAFEHNFGIKVVEMPHTLASPKFIHENPRARADDLMQAFQDPSIKAIISTIGGDDSIRILPFLDKNIIENNPKIFMGYSDTTVPLIFAHQLGNPCFYGPSIMSGFAENGGLYPSFISSVRDNLFENGEVVYTNPKDSWAFKQHRWSDSSKLNLPRETNDPMAWRIIQGKGIKSGKLIGGCLEVLDMMKGTDFWPPKVFWDDGILFLETSEECPSADQVIRSLRWYQINNYFKNIQAIVFGRWGGTEDLKRYDEYEKSLKDFFTSECKLPNLLVMSRLQFGHTDPMVVIPYGAEATIDSDKNLFTIKNL